MLSEELEQGLVIVSIFICSWIIQDKYYTERGFYFSLYDTPFSVATNNQELIENIRQFDPVVYQSNIQKFLEEKGCIEDGNASIHMAKK